MAEYTGDRRHMHGNARKCDRQTAEQQAEYVIIKTGKSKLYLFRQNLPAPSGTPDLQEQGGIHIIMEEDKDEKMCEMRHRPHR